jgi:hypothetical protein
MRHSTRDGRYRRTPPVNYDPLLGYLKPTIQQDDLCGSRDCMKRREPS